MALERVKSYSREGHKVGGYSRVKRRKGRPIPPKIRVVSRHYRDKNGMFV
jgi:hypothetical protein